MKQVLSSQCAIAALVLVFGAFSYTLGQTPSATPDPFVAQLTSSPAGGAGCAGLHRRKCGVREQTDNIPAIHAADYIGESAGFNKRVLLERVSLRNDSWQGCPRRPGLLVCGR